MADTTLPALLATGDHASRPAASAVGSGGLYSCTDHYLIYQSDGSSWATWADITGGGVPDQGAFTFFDATEGAAPATPAAGYARIYAKSDGRIYSKDDGGTEYGPFDAAGGGTTTLPTIVQTKTGRNAISSLTLDSAPADGNVVIVGCDGFSTADPTALSSTNTTWTKVANTTGGSAYFSIWVGVVSGGAGGTTITITHTNGYMSAVAMELDMTLTPTAVQSANGTNTASLTGVTAGHLVVGFSGPADTNLKTALSGHTLTTSDPFVGIAYDWLPLLAGFAASTAVAVSGGNNTKTLLVELT